MVELFTEEQLDEAFSQIEASIEFPIEGFLIGGLAMIKNDIKSSTKDIDIVFSDEKSAREFVRTAQKVGFNLDIELPPEYGEMKIMVVLKDAEERRIDVFVKTVLGGLTYSESMKGRAKTMKYGDKLTIHISSIEDIFLYKSITSRPRDLEDMETLARAGKLNWNHIEEEARAQPASWKWVGRLYYRLGELEEKTRILTPIAKHLEKDAELAQAIELVLGLLEDGPLSRNEIIEKLGEENVTFTEGVINKMMGMGLIRDEQGDLISQ